MEYTFYIKGTHRMTTVSQPEILRALHDAEYLLGPTQHGVLLWIPPTTPFSKHISSTSCPPVGQQDIERKEVASPSSTPLLLLEDAGPVYFPVFLAQAEHWWQLWAQDESRHKAHLHYTFWICSALYALYSSTALDQLRAHLLQTSGLPREIEVPAFEVALHELENMQRLFSAPYHRPGYHLFLCVLAFACLAVPAERTTLDRLREALDVFVLQWCVAIRHSETEEEM